jgi:hypothetical protein
MLARYKPQGSLLIRQRVTCNFTSVGDNLVLLLIQHAFYFARCQRVQIKRGSASFFEALPSFS